MPVQADDEAWRALPTERRPRLQEVVGCVVVFLLRLSASTRPCLAHGLNCPVDGITQLRRDEQPVTLGPALQLSLHVAAKVS